MSRGGRRRRGRRGPRSDQPAKPQQQGQQQGGARPGGRRRRRRGGGSGGEATGFATAVKEMSFRQATLQTLPDDGQVLDEVIGDLKTEYGVPATPQEYRLFIKIPVAEEASEKVAVELRVDPRDEEASVDGELPKARRRRRGRRRRKPGSGEAQTGATDSANDQPADEGSVGADDAEGGTI